MRLDIMRPIIFRSFICQRRIGNFRDDSSEMTNAEVASFGYYAYGDGVESPLAEDMEYFVFTAFFGHDQHALLGFGQQHLVSRHAGFTLRDEVEIDIDADAAAAAHFAG